MIQDSSITPSASRNASNDVEINLVQGFLALLQKRYLILGTTLCTGLLAVAIALLLPKTYTASCLFLPPINPELQGANSLFQKQDPSDLYLGMLDSHSVLESVVEAADLMSVYHAKFHADAIAALQTQSKFTVTKNSLISVQVTTKDPQLSATIANAYLAALYKVNGDMAISANIYRRDFLQAQLDKEKGVLASAEVDLQKLQDKTGIILPEGEAQAGLSATARIQSNIDQLETQLSSLLLSSTESSPQVINLRTQIASLRSQLRQQRLKSSGASDSGIPSSNQMSGVLTDYMRQNRELKNREGVYESLTQQYERARLSSLDPGPQLQIVDRAVVPERKSGPPRTFIVAAGLLFGLLVSTSWVLAGHRVKRLFALLKQGNPEPVAR